MGSLDRFIGLSFLDYCLVALSFIILLLIAYFTGKEEKDTEDYFLGARQVPQWIACLSFVATEISAMTIVGVPATGYRENLQYLQFYIGSALSKVVVAFLFIPFFYKFNCTTIYEFLKHRFGIETQYTGSIYFFIMRLLASGVRLYVACLGVSIILGWSLMQTLLLFTLVSIIFIAFGGIKAVVWNGAYQAIIFYVAGIILIGYLIFNIDGGITEAWRIAGECGRLDLWNLKFNLADPNTLIAAILNAFFTGLAAFGTDQELMQRLLTVKTRGSSQKALLYTIIASFPVTLMYILVGTLLFVYFTQNPQFVLPSKTDEILSFFTINVLPVGLKGMVLVAIIMASIDSPLSSLTSSFVTDIYRPLINKNASERHYLWVSRVGVIVFGLLLAVLAFSCKSFDRILWFGFKIIAITGSSLLGVFLLGLLSKRKINRGNILAMVINSVIMIILLVWIDKKIIPLGWSWLIVIGTAITFLLSYIIGPAFDKNRSL
ncbi:MAG: sodium/solute symporter [Candidatus Hydrogenedentota bacterium]